MPKLTKNEAREIAGNCVELRDALYRRPRMWAKRILRDDVWSQLEPTPEEEALFAQYVKYGQNEWFPGLLPRDIRLVGLLEPSHRYSTHRMHIAEMLRELVGREEVW